MASALRLLFLLCGISGLLTGVWSYPMTYSKNINCPQDWTQLDCKCYIYQDEARSFVDAEAVCSILGGNLVSIHNDLENAVVLQLLRAGGDGTTAWTGLHDAIEDGDYIWADGSEEDFLNFDVNATPDPEPNSSTGNCVEIDESDGLWQTAACTNDNVYICIMDVCG
ncbi:galactose-specific lectin nattectin-like [Phyllopteryx taeniolatus]|uniref:galactose-specific lectin nattectin-like n=1 Tax=Phyllopteryx taeniolatus TaxID=161469 RepID=UPI002AD3FAE2|nr:galactose-specific lectin nattectin-like [Phyllopteryx taeniolatus]